ncbi:MAG: enoyl-CoA hydratase/isomerase family protein [Acidimicrobiales bacterium]
MTTNESSTESSSDDAILVRRTPGVAVISINNPAQRNALTPDSADLLVRHLASIDDDPTVGVLIIRGEGGTFCSGANLSTLGSAMDDPASEESYSAMDRIYRSFTRLGEMKVPTIAAVRGFAVGAGVNLALAADVRVVSNTARIISGFAKIGLHPGGGHFQLLVQASSREAATAMGIFSQEISGARAAQFGLAWESVDDDAVDDRAVVLAEAAAKDPDLARKSIQSLRLTTPQVVPWVTALQAERAPQLWSLRRSADRNEKGPGNEK